MHRPTFSFLLLLFCFDAGAQVLNFDKVSAAPDSAERWIVAVQAATDYSSEKKVYDVDARADITRLIKGNHLMSLYFINSFLSSTKGDLQNSGFVHLRYRDNDTRKWSPEFFTQYQWDNLRGLVSRYLVGGNLRIRCIETKVIDLYAGIGLIAEWEKWNYGGVDSAKIPLLHPAFQHSDLLKLNQYIKVSLTVFKTTSLTFANYFQARPDKYITKPRIADFLVWNIPVSKKFSVNFNMESIYDAAPIVPIKHFYFSYSTGISLTI